MAGGIGDRKLFIYSIKCNKTGRIYIGRTTNIENRWRTHIHDLRLNKHHVHLMQTDFNKYGEDSFTFEILDEADFRTRDKEQAYMKAYDSYNPNFGYNYLDASLGDHRPKNVKIHDIACIYGVDESVL